MTVPHRVIYPTPANGLTARRRDEKATSPSANRAVRSAYLVSRVDDATPRHRLPATARPRGVQRASPPAGSGPRTAGQTAAVTTGFKQGLKGRQSPSQQSDVFTFASDTEAISPGPQRQRRYRANSNDDLLRPGRLYISANDLRNNAVCSSPSTRSSTSARDNTSGSILKKRPDGSGRLQNNSSSSSSSATVVSQVQDKNTANRPSGQVHKGRSLSSQRLYSDNSAACSPQHMHCRRVGFKNNVAVYHFDSDGEDSAGYSSTVSETSEQLDGHPRSHQRYRRRSPLVTAAPPASHDAAASWAAACGRSTAADRAGSPRYAADGNHDRHYYSAADNAPPTRLRSNSASSGRPQLTTISRTLHVADQDDDGERRWNGCFDNRTTKYDHPDCDLTQSQRQLAPDEGWVLSCGLVAVDNPLFIDRAHYEYIQADRAASKRLVLTCSLKNTNQFDPDCLVVKANRSGTQARIVFDAETDVRQDDQPSDKLLLPYTVDPYSLTAQLHGDNALVIEAPVSPSLPKDRLL